MSENFRMNSEVYFVLMIEIRVFGRKTADDSRIKFFFYHSQVIQYDYKSIDRGRKIKSEIDLIYLILGI